MSVGEQVTGSLLDNMKDVDGVNACADVVAALVSLLGSDAVAALPKRPNDIGRQLPAEHANTRRMAIYQVAGSLGVEHIVRALEKQPTPPADGRIVVLQAGSELHTAAKIAAVVGAIDGEDVTVEFNGLCVTGYPGVTPSQIIEEASNNGIY